MSKDVFRAGRSFEKPSEQTGIRVRGALHEWLAHRLPGTIAAYLSMSSEISVEPLFEKLPGWQWVLVRIEEDGTFTFRDRDVPVEEHRLGMRQPQGAGTPVAQNQIDFYLVPGVAFARNGDRLGRGGGFYDRILANRRPDSIAIGVCISEQLVDDLPTEAHDQPVDYIATEEGVIECSSTS